MSVDHWKLISYPNTCPSTPFVSEEDHRKALAEKDGRIAELEARLASPRQVGGYYIVLKEDYDEMKFRIGDMEDAVAKGEKAANVKEKRLACENGKYDKCGIGGMTVDCAEKAAKLAQQCIDDGKSISFAAACLIVLHRELEKRNRTLNTFREWNNFLGGQLQKISISRRHS